MKRTYIFFLLAISIFYSLSASSSVDHSDVNVLYNHMMEVNAEWSFISPEEYSYQFSFESETQRIKWHLMEVISYLNEHEPENLKESTIVKRRVLLDQLSDYAQAQVFPQNINHAERTPYFIDHRGVHCAVGYLMLASGHGDLVQRISSEHNYDYLRNISTSGISEWAEAFGFELNELKWIQPGYPPAQLMQPVGSGVNGEIQHVAKNSYEGIYFSGDFTELDGEECFNLGKYAQDQFHCLGEGVTGQINGLEYISSVLYLVGEFQNNGNSYPIAKFEDEIWSYMDIPERSGATGHLVSSGITIYQNDVASSYDFQVIISHEDFPGIHEAWFLSEGGSWEKLIEFNGEVNAIEGHSYIKSYGGNFSQVIPAGVDAITADNAIIFQSTWSEQSWTPMMEYISDEVYGIESAGESVFFCGSCGGEDGSEYCISRYFNGVLQPVVVNSYSEAAHYTDIHTVINEETIVCGDFNIDGFTWGANIGELDLWNNYVTSLGVLNGAAKAVRSYSGETYLLGAFTENLNLELNGIAKLTGTDSSISNMQSPSLEFYPNPSSDFVRFKGLNGEFEYSIYDLSGKVVKSGVIGGEEQLIVSDLSTGTYKIELESDNSRHTAKMFKL